MKILFWTPLYPPYIGGLEVFAHTLAKQLQAKGHTVVVISGTDTTSTSTKYELDGITVYDFPFMHAVSTYNVKAIRSILMEVQSIVSTFSPDVVHSHAWNEWSAFFQRRTFETFAIPLCITVHGLLGQPSFHTGYCKWVWERANRVTAVSKALKESLNNEGFFHSSLHVIYNGLPVQKRGVAPPRSHSLLMIGRFTEEKCFDTAFYALKLLVAKYPTLRMTLIGDGPLFSDLMELRSALELEDVLTLKGFIPHQDIDSYIEQSSVVVIPSSYESFCLVALEAAIAGRPVVASNVLGLTEVVDNGKTGILVEPKSPQQLAAGIAKILDDSELRIEMGHAAQKRAHTHFSIDQSVQQYCTLYEQLVKETNESASREYHYSHV